jgi:hypothetical protein
MTGKTYRINNTLDAMMLDSLLCDTLDFMASGDHDSARMAWEAFNLPSLGTIVPPMPMDETERANAQWRNDRATQHANELLDATENPNVDMNRWWQGSESN